MQAEVITNVGLIRKNNEDAFLCDPEKQIFVVADGMGGYAGGEVASALAVDVIRLVIASSPGENPLEILREACYQANNRIFETAKTNSEYAGMGTTLTAAWLQQDKIYLAHVGDSRAYLIRDGMITSLTKDHSLVGELMREGGLTEAEAMVHPQKNILTRALGCNAFVEVDLSEHELLHGDLLLLCTDGMSNLISSEEMAGIINEEKNIRQAVETLLNLALERGGYDNITVILVSNK